MKPRKPLHRVRALTLLSLASCLLCFAVQVTFGRHGGRKAKEFQVGLGEMIEDEAQMSRMPAIDFPLDAQNDSALWTVACVRQQASETKGAERKWSVA